jgi:hypothetical protein
MTSEFSGLPPQERMRAYRELALEALKAAEGSESKEARAEYLYIALQWEELAKDLGGRLLKGK